MRSVWSPQRPCLSPHSHFSLRVRSTEHRASFSSWSPRPIAHKSAVCRLGARCRRAGWTFAGVSLVDSSSMCSPKQQPTALISAAVLAQLPLLSGEGQWSRGEVRIEMFEHWMGLSEFTWIYSMKHLTHCTLRYHVRGTQPAPRMVSSQPLLAEPKQRSAPRAPPTVYVLPADRKPGLITYEFQYLHH